MYGVWHVLAEGDIPATHQEAPYEKWRSKPVLVVTRWGSMMVATVEHWEDADTPQWFSNCSEHWDMDGAITHWCELPSLP